MLSEHWKRVGQLFDRILELPEAEWSRFLDNECGSDLELRDEVGRLARQHILAEQSRFLETRSTSMPEPGAHHRQTLLPGRTISHYRIQCELGRGGMGIVYKAWDTRLDRAVALKVLLPHAAAGDDPNRLLQEAKSASALNHPNIVFVYEVGDQDGVHFIAMEYVAGKTLRELIPHHGMPPRQAAQWGGQIADALAAAHRRGIIHRDVKPENVMVCETGAVKLLDFGLAKAASGSLSTIQGAILGTVNYMSPEQALGGAADARSDIFSCGALLYEMITGRRAFTGDSPAAILAAVLQRDPMSDDAVSRMPPELRRITSRCLEKNPAKRFQRMSEVRGALAECSLNSGSLNLVSDGWKRKTAVAASILFIVGFARVAPSLHQFPRPNRPDTTAQSIDRADNRKLALEDFRCGFSSYGHWAPNEMNAAGGKFLSVVQLLPHGWQGYFGLAKTHLAETLLSGRSFDAKRKTIMGYAERAVELGPEIAVTHATLAAASLLLEWRWTDAEREIEQAIRWNPNNGEPYERRGQLRALQGRFADADRDFARALELRPDFDDCRLSRAWGDFLAGQPDLAIARVHDVIAATKKKGQAYRLLAGAHGAKGEFKEAGDALAKAWLPPLDKLNVEAWLAARQGNRRSAEAILEKIEALCRREELEYCDTALPETALGRYDRALDSLERGLRLRHWQLLFQSVDPRLNPLHGNPRWGEIILRLRSPY